jgi:hypothetical protein
VENDSEIKFLSHQADRNQNFVHDLKQFQNFKSSGFFFEKIEGGLDLLESGSIHTQYSCSVLPYLIFNVGDLE